MDSYSWEEEKSDTYTYYKRSKGQITSGSNYHQIIFSLFCSETNTNQSNCLSCVIQRSTSNTVLFNNFLNARDNRVFIIDSMIVVVNPDPIEGYMIGVPIIVSNKLYILMLPIIHSEIPMCDDLESN